MKVKKINPFVFYLLCAAIAIVVLGVITYAIYSLSQLGKYLGG